MIDPELARSIRLVGLDVDGVLTDGGIYLGAADGKPVEFKRYEIQDGLGMHFMQQRRPARRHRHRAACPRACGCARSSSTSTTSRRIRARRSCPRFSRMLDRHGIAPSEAAFVGDDFPDLAVLRLVGLPVAVGNAVPRSARRARCSSRGAAGAARCASSPSCCSRRAASGSDVTDAYVRRALAHLATSRAS